jgi:hypothetical protein
MRKAQRRRRLKAQSTISSKQLRQAGSWAAGKLEGIIFADCDGTVAAADHIFDPAQLEQQTAGGKVFCGTDDNKGTDSATGCGGNSRYFVNWSIAAHSQPVIVADFK